VQLAPFLVAAVVIVVTPGVDMALVARNALAHGRPAALATAFGVTTGIAVWALAAAAGLAAVVAASVEAFTAIKLAGAAYLVYLGIQSVRSARRPAAAVRRGAVRPLAARTAFRQGLVSNLLNPKIAVFFTSLLPQFVGHGSSPLVGFLLLGTIFDLIGLVWLTLFALAAARGRASLARPRVRAALDSLSGVVLVALGVRLAVERRA
jgi:threonine/homoserine/homoserine lactone efflux protein